MWLPALALASRHGPALSHHRALSIVRADVVVCLEKGAGATEEAGAYDAGANAAQAAAAVSIGTRTHNLRVLSQIVDKCEVLCSIPPSSQGP